MSPPRFSSLFVLLPAAVLVLLTGGSRRASAEEEDGCDWQKDRPVEVKNISVKGRLLNDEVPEDSVTTIDELESSINCTFQVLEDLPCDIPVRLWMHAFVFPNIQPVEKLLPLSEMLDYLGPKLGATGLPTTCPVVKGDYNFVYKPDACFTRDLGVFNGGVQFDPKEEETNEGEVFVKLHIRKRKKE